MYCNVKCKQCILPLHQDSILMDKQLNILRCTDNNLYRIHSNLQLLCNYYSLKYRFHMQMQQNLGSSHHRNHSAIHKENRHCRKLNNIQKSKRCMFLHHYMFNSQKDNFCKNNNLDQFHQHSTQLGMSRHIKSLQSDISMWSSLYIVYKS